MERSSIKTRALERRWSRLSVLVRCKWREVELGWSKRLKQYGNQRTEHRLRGKLGDGCLQFTRSCEEGYAKNTCFRSWRLEYIEK